MGLGNTNSWPHLSLVQGQKQGLLSAALAAILFSVADKFSEFIENLVHGQTMCTRPLFAPPRKKGLGVRLEEDDTTGKEYDVIQFISGALF